MDGDSDDSFSDGGKSDFLRSVFEDTDDEEEDFEGFTEEDFLPIPDQTNLQADLGSRLMKNDNDATSTPTSPACRHEDAEVNRSYEKETEVPIPNQISSQQLKKRRSDFDIMMSKKRELKERNKKNYRSLDECEDVILDVINQMRVAAEEDRALHKHKKMATKKLKILPNVLPQLKKEDLKIHFCDKGLLDVLADWLTPTNDILPHFNIRNALIAQLCDFSCIKKEHLRCSSIVKALRHLLKHDKETRENKEKLRQILSAWSRSVFNVKDNYYTLTEDERREISKIQKKKIKCNKEQEILQEESYYLPYCQKKFKETFEKMLTKPENTKSFKEKLKKFGSSYHNV